MCKLLTIILLLSNLIVSGQERFIGDKFIELKPSKFLSTKPIESQKVNFIENHYTLSVDKKELVRSLVGDTSLLDDEFRNIYKIVINYLNDTEELDFEYIWTKAEDFDDISWFETEKLGKRNLTKKILKEALCHLIENSGFELIEDEQIVENYFFERIVSNYGGSVKGVFSSSKRLIWICPPFIID